MRKIAVACCAVASALCASGATYYYIGPESASYTDFSNWADANGVAPTTFLNETLVFTNDAPVTLTGPSNAEKLAASKIRVTKGDVIIKNQTKDYVYIGKSSPAFEVAEGARLVCSNSYRAYYGSQTLTKTGKGLMEVAGNFDNVGSFVAFNVKEGTLRLAASAGNSQPTINVQKLTVKSGAKLVFRGGYKVANTKGSNAPVTIEEGASVELEDASGKVILNGITGGGDITALPGVASHLVVGAAQGYTGRISGNLYLGTSVGSAGVFTIDTADYRPDLLGIGSPDGFTFAAGITNFSVRCIDASAGGTLRLQDADGNPVSLTAKVSSGSKLHVEGSGNLTVTGSATFVGAKYKATGVLAVEGPYELSLGDNTAANDFTSETAPMAVRYSDNASVIFKPGSSHDVRIPVEGNGTLRVKASSGYAVRFHDLRNRKGTSGPLKALGINENQSAIWDLAGGSAVLPTYYYGKGGGLRFNIVSGGSWHSPAAYASPDTLRTLKMPGFVNTSGAWGWSSIRQTGGEFWTSLGEGLKSLHVRGGTAWVKSQESLAHSDGAIKDGGAAQLLIDGGCVSVPRHKGDDALTLLDGNRAATTVLCVGSNGAKIRAVDEAPGASVSFYCDLPVVCATNTATSGLLDVEHSGSILFSKPMGLNGPVRISDGTYELRASALDPDTRSATGSGLLTLRNATLAPSATSAFADAAVPGGLAFEGGALVTFGSSSNRLSVSSLSCVGPGSAMLVYTSKTALPFGEENGPKMTVAEGLSNDAATGALALPVYVSTGDSQRHVEFAKYDALRGIIPFDGYKTSLAETDASSIAKLSYSTSLAAGTTTSVGGICYVQGARDKYIELGKGATLKVGNGRDPAAIHFGVCNSLRGEDGTVDFGGSEGIFTIPTSHQGQPNSIGVKLAGTGGVSYFCFNRGHDQKVAVVRANVYTGGTRIWGVDVYARNADAFSSGDVYVGRGWCRGGRVLLDAADAVFANNFHLAGRGNSHQTHSDNLGRLYVNYRKGALSFAKNATISGNVVLEESARITVADGVTGVIGGVVSGDRLEIYKPFSDYEAGVVKLTGDNTYTGGTEVVCSTLSLGGGSGAGTGAVTLDNGVLQFENEAAVAFANDVKGAGRVRLAGAAVDFTGDLSKLSAPLELVGGARYEFSSVPPFSTITNLDSRRAEVTLKSPGVYDLSNCAFDGKIRLILEDGARIDLGGGVLNVYQFIGNPASVDGTVKPAVPCLGTVMIIR